MVMRLACSVPLVLDRARLATSVTSAQHHLHKARLWCMCVVAFVACCCCDAVIDVAAPCNGSAVYCPRGSLRLAVSLGYYSTPLTNDAAHRSGQAACEAGHYCVAGVRYDCAGGTYSTSLLLATPCVTPCEAGTRARSGCLMTWSACA